LDNKGEGYDSDIADAIIYAADQGAKVINLSLGGPESSQTLLDDVRYAESKGALVVAAAGNEGALGVDYPAAYSEVLAVGATVYDDNRASFSDYGPELDLAAPGALIPGLQFSTNKVVNGSGTSYASPHAAGVAALILSREPELNPPQLRSRLKATACDLGAAGRDDYFGSGRLDSLKALKGLVSGYIDGSVTLENSSEPAGVQVNLDEAGITFITGTDGRFSLSNVPEGNHRVSFKKDYYLTASRSVDISRANPLADLGAIGLMAGDLNLDNRIDMYDIIRLARKWGGQAGPEEGYRLADVDNDGLITQVDLKVLSAKFGTQGN
jgi:subtilisin family serine protease